MFIFGQPNGYAKQKVPRTWPCTLIFNVFYGSCRPIRSSNVGYQTFGAKAAGHLTGICRSSRYLSPVEILLYILISVACWNGRRLSYLCCRLGHSPRNKSPARGFIFKGLFVCQDILCAPRPWAAYLSCARISARISD